MVVDPLEKQSGGICRQYTRWLLVADGEGHEFRVCVYGDLGKVELFDDVVRYLCEEEPSSLLREQLRGAAARLLDATVAHKREREEEERDVAVEFLGARSVGDEDS